jgi:hypothetical protein
MPNYMEWLLAILAIIGFLIRIIPPLYRWVRKIAEKIVFKGKKLSEKGVSNLLILLCVVLTSASIAIHFFPPPPPPNPVVLQAKELSDRFLLQEVQEFPDLNKAIVYGSMMGTFEVPPQKTLLIVEIVIPSHGWGEGLSGPDGSSAQIIVDSEVREEKIDSSMPYHHGGYYKYGFGEHFLNTFQVDGESKVTLTINMVGGARLDLEKIILTFQ